MGVIAILLAVGPEDHDSKALSYTKFLQEVGAGQVELGPDKQRHGEITGKLKDGTSYPVQGPSPSLPNDVTEMRNKGVSVSFPPASTNLLGDLLPYIFIIGIGAALHLLHRPPDEGPDVGDHVDRPVEGQDVQ